MKSALITGAASGIGKACAQRMAKEGYGVVVADVNMAAAEALVRWFHPEKGVIFPSDSIPLFEGNGKICQLDLHMFTEVCKTLQRWQREGRHLLPMSFNLSRQHYFQNPTFLESFVQVAKEYQIPRGLLDFELWLDKLEHGQPVARHPNT